MLLKDYHPKSYLEVKSTQVDTPRFHVIDMHTHFGKLLMGDNYADLYDTKAVVESLKARGVSRVVNLDFSFGEKRRQMLNKIRGSEEFFLNFGSVDVEKFEQPGFEKMVYNSIKDGVQMGMRGMKLWKPIGLGYCDTKGNYLRPDDKRIQCIYQIAAEFKLPILFHLADPVAFFFPVDGSNERYEELQNHPDWSFVDPKFYRFHELMTMQENMISSNPNTTFIIAHGGSYSENLTQVAKWLDKYPNMHIDIAARISEFGRQPYTARAFLEKYCSRVFFGTDFAAAFDIMHPNYYRFLETDDEYFSLNDDDATSGQGRWNIYGVFLSDHALKCIYHENAEKLFML